MWRGRADVLTRLPEADLGVERQHELAKAVNAKALKLRALGQVWSKLSRTTIGPDSSVGRESDF